jgi:hypothetical protein
MLYYTLYVKGLNNTTGYIDVALADDQLLKDFINFLDVGIRPVRSYVLTTPASAQGKPVAASGVFVINLADVTAVTVTAPANPPARETP